MRKIALPWSGPVEAIVYIALALGLIGTINIFSASFVKAAQQLNDPYFFLKKHLQAAAVGVVACAALARADYRRLRPLTPLVALGVIVLLFAVLQTGLAANGAKRWLKIGIIFQPSEFAKLAALLVTAAFLGPLIDRRRPVTIFSWPAVLTAVMGALVFKQPDMGTAVVIVALSLLLYGIAGLPKHEFILLGAAAIGGAVAAAVAAPYRAQRIAAWFDPWAHQQDAGYQIVQSLLAIGSGGLTGVGLGMGASKFYYLPEAHTDFAFAILCQELGFVAAAVVLLLFILFALYGMQIALRAPDGYGMLLAAGATALIVCQAVGNIAMVSGVLPVTGVPLPFISYGGTALMVNLAAIGLLISVGRRAASSKGMAAPKPEPKRLRVTRPHV